MATAGEMIKVIALHIARSQATVTSFYSVLRKSGMISTRGRGRSAQDLSPLDVARAIIVMMSADSLQQAEAITHLVGQLTHEVFNRSYELLGTITFENALAEIISAKADQHHGRQTQPGPILGDLTSKEIEISVTASHLQALITIEGEEFYFINVSGITPGMTYPDEWEDIPMIDQLVLRAIMEGMAVTRSINDQIITHISSAMP